MWIGVFGNDPGAAALDVSSGDATPAQATDWAPHRLDSPSGALAHIHPTRSEWPAVQAAVNATVPRRMLSRVRWWIADLTGYPHMVPGANATQWYWRPDYDISTANPGFSRPGFANAAPLSVLSVRPADCPGASCPARSRRIPGDPGRGGLPGPPRPRRRRADRMAPGAGPATREVR